MLEVPARIVVIAMVEFWMRMKFQESVCIRITRERTVWELRVEIRYASR